MSNLKTKLITKVLPHNSLGIRMGWQTWELSLAVLLTSLFFIAWPTHLIYDDGGIILRYMDNFARGYFFSYNPSDGPIFGISGFLHGILGGFFAYTHMFSPLDSLFASNFIGLVGVAFLTFKLLDIYTKGDRTLTLVAWAGLILSAPYFVGNIKQGMETPLDLAFALLCFWAFLRQKSRLMWLSFVLAVIAKLDLVPLVGTLFIAYLFQNRIQLKDQTARNTMFKQFLVYGIIPGAVWLVFSYAVFGSLVPQTALAKLYYHTHASGSMFPFIEPLLASRMDKLIMAFTLCCFGGYLLYIVRARSYDALATDLVFGFSAFAIFALYEIFNPAEQMSWYYAVPEFLVRLQVGVIICVVAAKLAKRKIAIAVLLVFAAACWYQVIVGVRSEIAYLSIVETERIAVGDWVKQNSRETDTLFTGHGHIARTAGLYTIDYSGLNSRIATDYHLDHSRLIHDLQPDWIVYDGLIDPKIQAEGYVLKHSFYNSTLYRLPAWRIYERARGGGTLTAFNFDRQMIQTDATVQVQGSHGLLIEGKRVIFQFKEAVRSADFSVGLLKGETDLPLLISVYSGNRTLLKQTKLVLEKRDETHPVVGYTEELNVAFLPDWQVSSIEVALDESARGQSMSIRLSRWTKII